VSPPLPSGGLLAAAGGGSGAATHGRPLKLVGCAVGHPHDVLAALVAALRGVPQDFSQGEQG